MEHENLDLRLNKKQLVLAHKKSTSLVKMNVNQAPNENYKLQHSKNSQRVLMQCASLEPLNNNQAEQDHLTAKNK